MRVEDDRRCSQLVFCIFCGAVSMVLYFGTSCIVIRYLEHSLRSFDVVR
jgi:hypothetical protein